MVGKRMACDLWSRSFWAAVMPKPYLYLDLKRVWRSPLRSGRHYRLVGTENSLTCEMFFPPCMTETQMRAMPSFSLLSAFTSAV